MRGNPVTAMLLLAAVLASSAAQRAGGSHRSKSLAWFQPHTIFHSGLRGTHTIALTFDDGPNGYTRAVLAVLRKAHIKATFFIVGRMAEAHPGILREIAAAGPSAGQSQRDPSAARPRYDRHRRS